MRLFYFCTLELLVNNKCLIVHFILSFRTVVIIFQAWKKTARLSSIKWANLEIIGLKCWLKWKSEAKQAKNGTNIINQH